MSATDICTQSASSTPPLDLSSRQISPPQLLNHRKKYCPTHPHAQRLNASLAKLLALQLLPFHLVDPAPFYEFVECAAPQWQVPKRHFFSRKAIPALYRHVEGSVLASLDKAVSRKVHITADSWSSRHGQGRYFHGALGNSAGSLEGCRTGFGVAACFTTMPPKSWCWFCHIWLLHHLLLLLHVLFCSIVL